jgi:hypothetical protein
MQKQIDLGLVVFRDDHTEPPIRKAYLNLVAVSIDEEYDLVDEDDQETEEVGLQVMPSVIYKHTQPSVRLLRRIMGGKVFSNPKDHEVLARLIRYVTKPGDIILDSFAGSGTSGHAVLQLNHEDGGNRKFILVELEPRIARTVTAERLRRVIQGYTWTDQQGSKRFEMGLGGGFRYCTLGATIFHPDGAMHNAVTWDDLARHIWFTETRNPWPGRPSPPAPLPLAGEGNPCLGTFNGVAYYLYFNGIGGNTFGPAELAGLPVDEMPKVVYADMAAVESAELEERKVTFKQIPYDVKVY